MSQDYLNFGLALARKAGKMIKKDFSVGMQKEWKPNNTPLTKTDIAINEMVVQSVKKRFPNHSILAEEGSDYTEGSGFVWVCDPLDGTMPFSHGVPTCVFSLALVRDGMVVLGIVYDPFPDRMFVAQKGKGAFLNGKRISVSKSASLKNVVVGISNPQTGPYDMRDFSEAIAAKGAKRMNLLSITYMGMLVACGEFAAIAFPLDQPHDIPALKVIVEEAGGKVTDFSGKEQRYDRPKGFRGHLLSNGALHPELLRLCKKHIKKINI